MATVRRTFTSDFWFEAWLHRENRRSAAYQVLSPQKKLHREVPGNVGLKFAQDGRGAYLRVFGGDFSGSESSVHRSACYRQPDLKLTSTLKYWRVRCEGEWASFTISFTFSKCLQSTMISSDGSRNVETLQQPFRGRWSVARANLDHLNKKDLWNELMKALDQCRELKALWSIHRPGSPATVL